MEPGRQAQSLRSEAFAVLIICTAIGWTIEGLLQLAIPLAVLDRGGNAAVVGLVSAAYALPTLLLRPFVGRTIDARGTAAIHTRGAGIVTAGSLILAAPALVILPIARLVIGVGWAMFSTSNFTVLARLAPPARRAEATGYLSATYPLGFLIGPPLGILLYDRFSAEAVFLVVGILGLCAVAAAARLGRLSQVNVGDRRSNARSSKSPSQPTGNRFLERAAVPAMLMIALINGTSVLFVPFAPVVMRAQGAPVGLLALHFATYSCFMAIGQLGLSRLSDRTGRRATVVGGSLLAGCSVALAAIAFPSSAAFIVAGAAFALAAGVVLPTVSAAAIDIAPEGRMGSTVATYTTGFQLGAGVGGLLWGFAVVSLGVPWTLAIAGTLPLAAVALATVSLSGPRVHE